MSKRARKGNKERRDMEKRRRRDAMRALYASWRDQGSNSKRTETSKRVMGPAPQATRRAAKRKRPWYGELLMRMHAAKRLRRKERRGAMLDEMARETQEAGGYPELDGLETGGPG